MNTYRITCTYVTSRAMWKIVKVERSTETGVEALSLPKQRMADTLGTLRRVCESEYIGYGEGEYVMHIFNVCEEERHDLASATFYALSRDGTTCFVRCPCGRMRHVPREMIQAEKESLLT